MKTSVHRLLLCFSAGSAGGLMNSIFVWLFGFIGINQLLGVAISPTLTPQWLYPRIVWGGLWGFVFIFMDLKKPISLTKVFLISLGPSLVQLLIVFPFKAQKGFLGLELGLLTPALVLFFNFVWGLVALLLLNKNRGNHVAF
ncbi:MAG: hypothetical protein KDD50_07530 [Bdellovibrionales bacterium]|nr:hypothetical protein [Bdellovibrionales bacterium]